MSSLKPSDILFYAGGASLERFGPITRKTTVIARRSEEVIETFTRASTGLMLNRSYDLISAASGLGRVEYMPDHEQWGVLVEGPDGNRVTYADDFSNWANIGTPIITANAIGLGEVALSLIEDNDAGNEEGVRLVVDTDGDGLTPVAVYWKKGASPGSYTRLALDDTDAAAARLEADIVAIGNAPDVTMQTGTYIGADLIDPVNFVYRLYFQTTAVTAANAHRIDIYPAFDGNADLGDVYVGGVWVGKPSTSDHRLPTSHVATAGAVGSRVADTCKIPISIGPGNMTIYVRVATLGWVDVASTAFRIFLTLTSEDGAGATDYIELGKDNSTYKAFVGQKGNDGSGNSTSTTLAASTDPLDLAVQYDHTNGQMRLDPGTGTFGSWVPVDKFTAPFIEAHLGHNRASAEQAGSRIIAGIVGRGLHTSAEFAKVLP